VSADELRVKALTTRGLDVDTLLERLQVATTDGKRLERARRAVASGVRW
jgi:hypothetical protein